VITVHFEFRKENSMTSQNLPLLLIAVMISACSGGGSADPSSATAPPVSSAASSPSAPADTPPTSRIIDNEDMTAGLKGVDANNNGIRDDIDRLIALKYSATPAMRKAAEQEAKALQKILNVATKTQARIAFNESGRASDCTYKNLSHATAADVKLREQMSIEIEALTSNTKERFTAYWQANSLAGGMVFSQAQEPVCD